MIQQTFNPDIFKGRTALVTGAAAGIGAGIARAFAELGADVVLQDVDAAGLAATSQVMPRGKGKNVSLEGDLTRPGSADEMFDRALAACGRVDFLVNNAGRSLAATALESLEEPTQELIELNLKSVLWLSKRIIGHAQSRPGGASIVQVSSTAGIAGFERRAVYCATKFGVIGLTRALALDHAREGVRVNAILPHVVETDMFRRTAKPAEAELWRAGIPMGRFAAVEDVAALVMFLCSPAASYLTGGLYPIDGGAMAGPFGGSA